MLRFALYLMRTHVLPLNQHDSCKSHVNYTNMRLSTMCVVAAATASAQINMQIGGSIVSSLPPYFLGFGWEMWAMLGMVDRLSDPRLVALASHLKPSLIRVGGITADWVKYTDLPGQQPGHLTGFWPNAPNNLPLSNFTALLDFFTQSGLSLLFDLNELYGRNCNTTNPVTNQPDWCVGAWDTSNLQQLLSYVQANNLAGGDNALIGFELGNELITHLDPVANTQDILTLAEMVKQTWSGSGSVPPVYAPSTDACYSNSTRDIMVNTSTAATGFTFHNYPGQDGSQMPSQLTNATWLRNGIMTGADASTCVGFWNAGPKTQGMQLWITETSASWNWQLPPPAQNSYLHGYYTLASAGQYAEAGITFVGRWSFSEGSPFATIAINGTRYDVAADYWLYLVFKRVIGSGVLTVTGDESSGALLYAYCTPYNNGSVTVTAVNPSTSPITITAANVGVLPRQEYVFTAPGGNVSAIATSLNGGGPLRANEDGSIPDLLPVYQGSAATITLQPQSQSFFVLLNAGVAACN